MDRHWVAIRCEASGASEAMPTVAEVSKATCSYRACSTSSHTHCVWDAVIKLVGHGILVATKGHYSLYSHNNQATKQRKSQSAVQSLHINIYCMCNESLVLCYDILSAWQSNYMMSPSWLGFNSGYALLWVGGVGLCRAWGGPPHQSRSPWEGQGWRSESVLQWSSSLQSVGPYTVFHVTLESMRLIISRAIHHFGWLSKH